MPFKGLTPVREAAATVKPDYYDPDDYYETFRQAVRDGRIPSIRIGKRYYLTDAVLHALHTGEGAETLLAQER